MLKIKNLHVAVHGTEILKGLDLEVGPGEVHAIMGPNGSGKSTLSYVLAGREGYEITKGAIMFDGKDLADMAPEKRAAAGMFLAFQYPVEIPGVTANMFLKESLNAIRKARGETEMDAVSFMKKIKETTQRLDIDPDMLKRGLNVGFSGGEKKRMEALQLAMLEPKFAVLDETDSGLDIDALKTVADGVNALRTKERSFLIITHYQRLLNHIKPDVVHVLVKGKIQKTGGPELAEELEQKGYAAFGAEEEAA